MSTKAAQVILLLWKITLTQRDVYKYRLQAYSLKCSYCWLKSCGRRRYFLFYFSALEFYWSKCWFVSLWVYNALLMVANCHLQSWTILPQTCLEKNNVFWKQILCSRLKIITTQLQLSHKNTWTCLLLNSKSLSEKEDMIHLKIRL